MPFYTLFFLSAVSNVGITHAAGLMCFPQFLCTPTPVPTSAPTPTPAPPPAPTPTPIPYVQPTPTSSVPQATPLITPTPVPITPTPTLASVTATTVTVSPTKGATTKTDTIFAHQQSQGAGDKGGVNIVVLSMSIAIPVLLVTGGMIWLLWRRQASQDKLAMQGMYGNAQAPWMNNYGMSPNTNTFQYASSAGFAPDMSGMSGSMPAFGGGAQQMPSPYVASVPAALTSGMSGSMPAFGSGAQQMPSPYVAGVPAALTSGMSGSMPAFGSGAQQMQSPYVAGVPAALTPGMSGSMPAFGGGAQQMQSPYVAGVPAALTPGMSGSMPAFGGGAQQMSSPQLAYTPSDFRPITAAFSQQMLTGSLDSGVRPAAQNGDLLSRPMDTLSLSPQSARAGDGNWNEQTGPIATLQPSRDTPIPFESSPLPVPSVSLRANCPPSIKEDSMLEESMRQAQIGLFSLLGR